MIENAEKILENRYLCDNCLGRVLAGQLLSGISNKERGRIIRYFLAFLFDSDKGVKIDLSNFYGIKFKKRKIKIEKQGKCFICKNFFEEKIEDYVSKIVKKVKGIDFRNFLVGTKVLPEILNSEEKIWEEIGIENAESIKTEINREIGKRLEKILNKRFERKNPEITILVDMTNESVRIQIQSLFIYGEYKKLERGFPQAKWICPKCKGKGCTFCKGEGKLYKTSIQEIIERPFLKFAKAKKSALHAEGREDIDTRCLDWRPFVIEIKNPFRRELNLKKILREINKSKKIKVSKLEFVDKSLVREIKSRKKDKTYLAMVLFKKCVDEGKLKNLKILEREPILQQTPLRVLHRRAKKVRKRIVKKISWKVFGKKKVKFKITAQSGLYIKELITGDGGRTKPSISEILGNEAKKIVLDVIKIHKK
ncbi:MAG: tRNA pseudouridine(54/55) synthase Pus10 [Candidatus Aenigmatarchaeota archaeon]